MTTEPQTPPNDAIPPWFMEFANENTRQHANLASQTAESSANLASQIAENSANLASQTAESSANLASQIADARLETAGLRAEMIEKIGALETRIAENRAETHRELVTLMRWVVGTIAGMGVAVVGSLVYVVERLAQA